MILLCPAVPLSTVVGLSCICNMGPVAETSMI